MTFASSYDPRLSEYQLCFIISIILYFLVVIMAMEVIIGRDQMYDAYEIIVRLFSHILGKNISQ